MKKRKVRINFWQDRIVLKWVCPVSGKAKSLSLGGLKTSRAAMRQAEDLKDRIEKDQENGDYDPTLVKYRPKTIGKNATEISAPEMFGRFTRYQAKQKGLAESSIEARYQPVQRYLEKYLNLPVNRIDQREAERLASICGEKLTARTAKERLAMLKTCWDWAVGKYAVAKENPWVGKGDRFKSKPVQKTKPFSKAEVAAIVDAFRNHPNYNIYTDFVVTLFSTGARFGEIAGLKWKNVASDFGDLWIGESVSRGRRGATKTGKDRTVPLSGSMVAMLRDRKEQFNPQPEDLVFPRRDGGAIDDNYFRKNCWARILASLNIPYRKPYCTRHTQLSHQLAAGISPIAVAANAGNSPRMLYQHYASAIDRSSVLIDFGDLPTP